MRRIIKVLLVTGFIILIVGLSAFSWLYYSGRINTYQIITITNTDSSAVNFKAFGISPFGRKIPFEQKDSCTLFSYFSFLKQVEIYFNEEDETCKHDFIIDIGNIKYHYTITGNKPFIKPFPDRGNILYGDALLSVTQWTIVKKALFWFIIILVLVLAFMIIRWLRGRVKFIVLRIHRTIDRMRLCLQRGKEFSIHLWLQKEKYLPGYKIRIKKSAVFIRNWVLFILSIFVLFIVPYWLKNSGYSTVFLFALMTICLLSLYIILFKLLTLLLRKNSKLKKNMLLLMSSIFIAVFMMEILLRILGTAATYIETRSHCYQSIYKPLTRSWYYTWTVNTVHYLSTPEYNYERRTNSLGLSDIEHPLHKDSNELRIVGIGDSFTEGDGADEDSTWLKFLERNIKPTTHRKIRFINAGVCGSDPYFEYVLLRDKLLPYKPDVVVLAVNFDVLDIIVRGGMERFRPDGTVQYLKPPSWEWAFSLSHIFRLIISNVFHYDKLLISSGDYPVRLKKAYNDLYESLLICEGLSEKQGFKLLVVLDPSKKDINSKKFEDTDKTEQFCRDHGISCLNLLEYFLNQEKINGHNSSGYYWKHDGHHNAKGYAAFARGVGWKLKQMGIMDTLSTQRN